MFSCDLAHVVQAHVDKGASYRGTSWVEKVHVRKVLRGFTRLRSRFVETGNTL